jgi:hypothetical protein
MSSLSDKYVLYRVFLHFIGKYFFIIYLTLIFFFILRKSIVLLINYK